MSRIDRRTMLKGTLATTGLVIGLHLPERSSAEARGRGANASEPFAPNAFLRISPDDEVTIVAKHTEWGMGIHTTLAMMIAEELDARWEQVKVEPAPANEELYKNLIFDTQNTAGSNSVRNSWEQYRRAGATGRAMLVSAAAQAWNVDAAEITVGQGVVRHDRSRREATFGELADAAARQPVPDEVPLKDVARFRLIGAEGVRRLDTPMKIDGRAKYAIDVTVPGMLTALIARSPRFGGTVRSFNRDEVRALPGVRHVVEVPTGVAVVADSFTQAKRARDRLRVSWDDSKAETKSTSDLVEEYSSSLGRRGNVARKDGDVERALARAQRTITGDFEYPYLAHAPLEPGAVVVRLGSGGCEIWTGDGSVTLAQEGAAKILGIDPKQVTVHSVYAGGSFGRKDGTTDEAVEVAKAIGGRTPVKVMWSREDEIRHSFYRPLYVERVTVGLDRAGDITAWRHQIVGQAIMPPERRVNGVDWVSVDGAANIPYDIPNILVDLHTTENGVPTGTLRGTAASHTCHSVETMLDDVAAEIGRDPLELRRTLMGRDPNKKDIDILSIAENDRFFWPVFHEYPRQLRTLELAAKRAGWGTRLGRGRGRGVATNYGFLTSVAMVAEVTAHDDRTFHVDRMVCAVDCGVAVNPDIIRSQIEGSVAWGLSIMLYGAITLDKGVVEQSTYRDYQVVRMDQMPRVEVHIVPSDAPPRGVGQVGVATVAPAVSNALFAATGRRLRKLPFSAHRRG
jgi:isoquinoline 1-oxidoreductase beta subunit